MNGKFRPGLRALALVVLAQAIVGATAAMASWAGANPKGNFHVRSLPQSCFSNPAGPICINAGIYWLDKARAWLHQPAYKLPADFVNLSAEQQAFILVNLDRVQYGLAPIPGLTGALDRDALGGMPPRDPGGVRGDGDPLPTDSRLVQFTSNWAGGFPNIVFAYEAWMYDDGYHSMNGDCTAPGSSGCWGHRHDVLWKFVNSGGPQAMGVAAGKDSHGQRGYAMLLVRGNSAYHPAYTYTWSKAVADGAHRHPYQVSQP